MGICAVCKRQNKRPNAHGHLTEEFYEATIVALRHVAQRCGYALTVHGSLSFDIDLVAVPWRNSCTNQEYLAEQIRKTAEVIIGFAEERAHDPNPEKKPHGRLGWTFYLGPQGVDVPYIDLSIVPPSKDE